MRRTLSVAGSRFGDNDARSGGSRITDVHQRYGYGVRRAHTADWSAAVRPVRFALWGADGHSVRRAVHRAEGIKTAEEAATWGGTAGIVYDPC